MPLGAIIGAVGGLAGAFIQGKAAKDAAEAQADAAGRAAKIQWRMFKTARKDLRPYAQVGKQGLYGLARLYGLRGEGGYKKALDQFYRSPDYKIAQREGVKAIDASAAARGNLLSGANLKAVTSFGSDLASQKFGAYIDRLQQIAGLGETAAAGQGNAALSSGRGIGSSFLNVGEAQASGAIGFGNALSQGIADFGNNLGKFVSAYQ